MSSSHEIPLLGIVTEKLNDTKKSKPDTAALFNASGDGMDFTAREEIYSAHRKELIYEFRFDNYNQSFINCLYIN